MQHVTDNVYFRCLFGRTINSEYDLFSIAAVNLVTLLPLESSLHLNARIASSFLIGLVHLQDFSQQSSLFCSPWMTVSAILGWRGKLHSLNLFPQMSDLWVENGDCEWTESLMQTSGQMISPKHTDSHHNDPTCLQWDGWWTGKTCRYSLSNAETVTLMTDFLLGMGFIFMLNWALKTASWSLCPYLGWKKAVLMAVLVNSVLVHTSDTL